MIKKIKTQIQSHYGTKISLHKGVNHICGISMSGKSVIVKGLRWAAFNRPLGFDGFPWKKKTAFCEVTTNRGWARIFKNREGRTKYKTKTDEYRAIGSNVPEEVRNILLLNSTNFSLQNSRPFLIDQPGELAKEINRITKQEKAQHWIKRATDLITSGEEDLSALMEREKTLNEEVSSLRKVTKLKPIIRRMVRYRRKLRTLKRARDLSRHIFERKSEEEKRRKRLKKAIPELTACTNRIEILRNKLSQYRYITDTMQKRDDKQEEIDTISLEIKKIQKRYDRAFAKLSTCPFCGHRLKEKTK